MKTAIALIAPAACAAPTAHADKCEAELPTKEGTKFSGVVKYVGDGDSICVGTVADPKAWIEVRLSDYYAPELKTPAGKMAKAIAEKQLKGKSIECTVVKGNYGSTTSWDRVFGKCTVNARAVGDIMLSVGAPTGGNGTGKPKPKT